jgi:ribose-phosphate pyrophosphokinase
MHIIGDVKGKTAIFIDDLIDTAGTITLGAEALIREGASDVYACCTHPVFSGSALERLSKAPIKEVIFTNTIPVDRGQLAGLRDCFRQLTVAPLIAEAIIRIQNRVSVSELFD